MTALSIAAAIMAVIFGVAAWRRPRMATVVAAMLWALDAIYEYMAASGVLCDGPCTIRVDLFLIIPVLLVATLYAGWGSMRPERVSQQRPTIVGTVLGAVGLFVAALICAAFGYFALAGVICAASLALIAYAIRSRSVGKLSPDQPA